jgi:hypothetical protein
VYELRLGREIISTGRVLLETAPPVGSDISVASTRARVVDVLPGVEPRLILDAANFLA